MSDPSTPGSGPAGWQPDPTGRHQYRYWDGSAFTDNVSDGGATSVDPMTPAGSASNVPPTQSMPTSPPTAPVTMPAPVATPGPAGPTFAPPGGGPPAGGPPPSSGGGSSKAPLIIGAIVVVALLVAGFLLFKGDDGGGGKGAGTFTLDVPKGGNATHKISLKDNELLLITATPKDKNLDVVLGVAVDLKSAGGKALDDLFTLSEDSSDLSDNGKLPATVVQTFNDQGNGKAEKGETPSPKALDATVVVGGQNGDAGKVELKLEVIQVKAKADALEYLAEACKNAKFKAFEPDLCAENFSSDFTDLTDSFSDFSDFTDLSDPFSDFSDFTDFSDPFSDFSDFSDFTDLFSDFSSFTDFFSS
jgi:hypothetical protein